MLGKSLRPEIPAALAIAMQAPDPASPEPAPTLPVVEEPEPPPAPVVLDEPAQLSARSTLIAFLDAPDWKSRGAYVLLPESVMPAMEAHAKENGDGPIRTTSIRLQEARNGDYFYQVSTASIPDGFPVSVIATDEGPMVDWESFVGFHDDHFRKFIDGPFEQHAVLDLLVKPVGEQGHFFRYRLAVPMAGREADAYVRKDSVVFARLRGVLEGSSAFDKATIDRFLAAAGVPMTLALVKRETGDGRSFFEIEDFVAPGWGP